MATNKTLELRDLSDEDLRGQLTETTESYHKMQFDHTANQSLENPLQLRSVRRDIARIKTELRRRELDTQSPDQLAKRDNIRRRRRKK